MIAVRSVFIVLLLASCMTQGYAVQSVGNGGTAPPRPPGSTTNESVVGKHFIIYSTGDNQQILKGNLGLSDKEMTFVGLSCGTLVVPYTVVKPDPKAQPKGTVVQGVLPIKDGQITVKAEISFTTTAAGVWTKNAIGTITWGPREIKPDPKAPKSTTGAKEGAKDGTKDGAKPDQKPDAKEAVQGGKDKAPTKVISFTTAKPGNK